MAETDYLVFVQGNDGRFLQLSKVAATTPKTAIERVVDSIVKQDANGDLDAERTFDPVKATYAATPIRNWTLLPVEAEVITRIKVG